MARYSLLVRRGDMEYELNSSDKEVVTSQIDFVFAELKNQPFDVKNATASELKLATENRQPIIDKPAYELFNNMVNTIEMPENVADNQDVSPQQAELSFVQPVNIQPQQQFIPPQPPLPQANQQSQQSTSQGEQFDVKPFVAPRVDKVNDNETKQEALTSLFDNSLDKNNPLGFGTILENKITNNDMNEVELEFSYEDFSNFIKTKKINNLIDYLVVTAYYMLETENVGRFQLKQLNQRLFSTIKLAVNHKTIQQGLDDGFLRIVPDLTGKAKVTEYSLTRKGEEYYHNVCL